MSKKWTNVAITEVFKALPNIEVNKKKVGYYTPGWNGRTPGFTIKEWSEVMDKVLRVVQAKGHLLEVEAGSAVFNYLNHCFHYSNHPNYRKLRHRVRTIAYACGFMEMTDIVELEARGREKYGARP